jgi:hypothetical protein
MNMFILLLIFVAVFASVGIQFAMEPDMIMEWYYVILKRLSRWRVGGFKLGLFIAKPLGFCITCNSHWVAFILFYFNFEWFARASSHPWFLLEGAAISVCGLSTLAWFSYNKMKELEEPKIIQMGVNTEQIDHNYKIGLNDILKVASKINESVTDTENTHQINLDLGFDMTEAEFFESIEKEMSNPHDLGNNKD